jgi:hypothetical protein
VPVRLDASWMCPVHAVVIESQAGSCKLCGRTLVPVVVSLTWSCRGEVNAEFLEPGVCRDGSPRIGKRTLRPHGNHNPQHGGQFFMAPDTWHHLEGTLPRALPPAALAAMNGRVVTRQRFDAATRTTVEEQAFTLKPSKDGKSLEATIPRASLPAALSVKVKFKPDAPEYRFDFTFRELTREPAGPKAAATRTPPAPAAAPSTPAPAADADPLATPPPGTMSEMIAELRKRRAEIDALIKKGDYGAVWVPAFQAKDMAVALEPHVAHLGMRERGTAEPALADVVRTAWLLDSVGDTGNGEEVARAFTVFDAAVTRLLAAFEPAP